MMRLEREQDLLYDDAPPVAVVSLGGDLDPALEAIAGAGARPTGPFNAADVSWSERAVASVLWVEVGAASDEAAGALLDEIEMGARAGRWSGVVAVPTARLDLLAARVTHGALQPLIGTSPIDARAALALALGHADARRFARVHEGGASDVERLRRLTDEVGRIAHALAQMSGTTGKGGRAVHGDVARGGRLARSSGAVRAMVRARRLRDQFFQAELFADPAWDMLLDLYAAYLDQHRVAVSSLCIASAVPATTALRWIKTLTDAGLFVRRADPTDGRRVFIELSEGAAAGMEAYFSELERQAEGAAFAAVV